MKHIESDKLGAKYDKCLFMEYPKGYNLYRSSEQNCLFQSMQLSKRNSFSYRKQWEYKLELDKVQDPQIEADGPIKPTTVELADSTYEPHVIYSPRKSVKVRTEHEMYIFQIDGDQSKTLIEGDEPQNYDKF